MKIIDLYLNSKKFTYGSVVSKYKNKYLIKVGKDKTFTGDSFKEALIKSTNNYLLKILFLFCDFDINDRYYRNQFSGNYKSNWKNLYDCTYLAWEVGGSFNNEHKYISKVGNPPKKLKTKLLIKLRKRFQIYQEKDYYYVGDNNSLHWDDTFPYKYLPNKSLDNVIKQRRELILNSLNRKPKKL